MRKCPNDKTIKEFEKFLPDEVAYQKEALAAEAEESYYDEEEDEVSEKSEDSDPEQPQEGEPAAADVPPSDNQSMAGASTTATENPDDKSV